MWLNVFLNLTKNVKKDTGTWRHTPIPHQKHTPPTQQHTRHTPPPSFIYFKATPGETPARNPSSKLSCEHPPIGPSTRKPTTDSTKRRTTPVPHKNHPSIGTNYPRHATKDKWRTGDDIIASYFAQTLTNLALIFIIKRHRFWIRSIYKLNWTDWSG